MRHYGTRPHIMASAVISTIFCTAPCQAFLPTPSIKTTRWRAEETRRWMERSWMTPRSSINFRQPLPHRVKDVSVERNNASGYATTTSRHSLAMLSSNSPQEFERGWLTQVAEGNLFPNKPRSAVAVTACRLLDGGRTEYLLIQRGKAPNYGEWSLPGGSIELGEPTLAAAKRELMEETHLSQPDALFFDESFMTSDAIVQDGDGRMLFHYVIAQVFALVGKDAQVRAGDDAMDVAWFTIQDIRAASIDKTQLCSNSNQPPEEGGGAGNANASRKVLKGKGTVTRDVLKVVERAAALQAAGLLHP